MKTLRELRAYFKEELETSFSSSEIKLIFNVVVEEQLNITDAYYLCHEADVPKEASDYFLDFVAQLKKSVPFQQLIGYAEFYGLKIKVNSEVLIPRPETAELVDLIYQDFKKSEEEKLAIVDVCSGSGCIALALKSKFENASIMGYEKSTGALAIARENQETLNLNVQFFECDVLTDSWNLKENSLDVLVSNPPYVLQSESSTMSDSVLNYEPSMALFVEDNDPLLFYKKIAQEGRVVLKPSGKIYFEINERYGNQVAEYLENVGYQKVTIVKDLQGKERMVVGEK